MGIEKFRWLAAAIAAHPDRRVVGRTRLQKEIRLLQRLGFPTDYSYTIHFYGPYSEGLHADIGLLESLELIDEESHLSQQGDSYYVLRAKSEAALPEMKKYQRYIEVMEAADSTVLELAATYDTFRAMGADHKEAMGRLRRKKGSKCDGGNDSAAIEVLRQLGLPVN